MLRILHLVIFWMWWKKRNLIQFKFKTSLPCARAYGSSNDQPDYMTFCSLSNCSSLESVMCRFKPLSWRDDKLQIVHLLGLSPLWMRRCLFRYSVQLNPFWHSLHLWAFWSLCIFACCFEFAKLLVFCIVHIWLFQCVKACELLGFQQNWNLCCIVHIWNVFFSVVCINKWLLKFSFWLDTWLHCLHLYRVFFSHWASP